MLVWFYHDFEILALFLNKSVNILSSYFRVSVTRLSGDTSVDESCVWTRNVRIFMYLFLLARLICGFSHLCFFKCYKEKITHSH